jgi:hypothetical protein
MSKPTIIIWAWERTNRKTTVFTGTTMSKAIIVREKLFMRSTAKEAA